MCLEEMFGETEPSKEKYLTFAKMTRYMALCTELIDAGKTDFDWKYLASKGKLCERDFDEEFWKDELIKVGVGSYQDCHSEFIKNTV
jgi:hypothetical protein